MSKTSITLNELLKRLLRHGQCFLVYPAAFEPKPRYISRPSEHLLPYKDIDVGTSDGILLRCYLIEHPTPRSTVLMFHGNGMNHGDMLEHAKHYHDFQCNVMTVSYRGYGNSEGLPTEKGLQRDAQAVLDHILNDPVLAKLPIIIYGISLGGAVAIDVASRNPEKIAALIIENTFTSLPNVVRAWPVLGRFSFICTQKWNSASKIIRIPPSLPVLFLSGRADSVVPPEHMDELWKLAKERGKLNAAASSRRKLSLSSLSIKSIGSGACGKVEEMLDDEDVEGGPWSKPAGDRFVDYLNGGHVGTYRCRGYWRDVEKFVRRSERM